MKEEREKNKERRGRERVERDKGRETKGEREGETERVHACVRACHHLAS